MNISSKKVLFLIGLISVAVLTAALIHTELNLSFFLGLIFNDAKEFAESGTISSNFMPIGYSGFLGFCIKIAGINGIPACQAFIYIAILLTAFWFLKLRGASGLLLLLGVLFVALHPLLVLNIWRIHDGNPTVFLLLGFLAAGIFWMRSKTIWSSLILGISTGLLFLVRQNTIIFFLLPLLFLNNSSVSKAKSFAKYLVFLIIVLILLMSITMAVKQKPFFFGEQGAYNFFSGANEYSLKYLLKDYSGENSHKEALEARGFSSVEIFEERLSFPQETYTELALDYIKSHPLEYMKLAGLKLFTLLRPGYHKPEDSERDLGGMLKQFSKIILALPFFVWLFFVYKTRNNFFERENLFIFLVVILYILPFILANADPRYRFPLDIIFIADSFCRARGLSFSQRN